MNIAAWLWIIGARGWRIWNAMGIALPFTSEFRSNGVIAGWVIACVQAGWDPDHLGVASCWFLKKLGPHVNRVVVVDLPRSASRVFLRILRFSSLRKNQPKLNPSYSVPIDNSVSTLKGFTPVWIYCYYYYLDRLCIANKVTWFSADKRRLVARVFARWRKRYRNNKN